MVVGRKKECKCKSCVVTDDTAEWDVVTLSVRILRRLLSVRACVGRARCVADPCVVVHGVCCVRSTHAAR